MKKILLLLMIILWTLISWRWYTCSIKGFCGGANLRETAPIVIDPVDPIVDRQPREVVKVPVVEIVKDSATETIVDTSVKNHTGECLAYLDGYVLIDEQENNTSKDVRALTRFLNMHESEELTVDDVYDAADEDAVRRFQVKYRSEVLDPWGIKESTGRVYKTTRDHINRLYCEESR